MQRKGRLGVEVRGRSLLRELLNVTHLSHDNDNDKLFPVLNFNSVLSLSAL